MNVPARSPSAGATPMALGNAAQNIGIVCQEEGEAARQHGDEATAQQWFAEAERFLQESLRMEIDRQDKPGEARSRESVVPSLPAHGRTG